MDGGGGATGACSGRPLVGWTAGSRAEDQLCQLPDHPLVKHHRPVEGEPAHARYPLGLGAAGEGEEEGLQRQTQGGTLPVGHKGGTAPSEARAGSRIARARRRPWASPNSSRSRR